MENSKIEWTDATVNFWWGCTKVSPGCANCYADTLAGRFGKDIWGKGKPREDHRKGATKLAMKLQGKAEREGRRIKVFCSSMADLFDPEVPIEWLADALNVIRRTPNLDWQILTKRPELWRERVNDAEFANEDDSIEGSAYRIWLRNWFEHEIPPTNVWMGTSVEDQKRADGRIPALLAIPARVRFLSCEPLLGEVRLLRTGVPPLWQGALNPISGIHWVIVGGESGPKARPMHPAWARSLRDQCQAAGVAFFMKQMGGAKKPFPGIPEDLMIRQFPA